MSIPPEYLRRIIVANPPEPDWTVTVYDKASRVIARSGEHETYVGRVFPVSETPLETAEEAVHRASTSTGEEVLRGYRRSSQTRWLTAAAIPSNVIEGPLRNLWRLFWLVAVSLAAISLPLALYLGRQISEPISAAADAATRLGRGELVQPISSRLTEANDLSLALSHASRELREHGRELAENEARFRSVFEQAAVGFEQVALDGRLLGVNDRLCKMLGYTREECLEKTFKVLTHPEDWTAEEEQISAILNGDSPHYEIEKRLITKSGDPMWVRVTSALVRDVNGKVLYRTSVIEDVTESRKARQAAAQLAAIVLSSTDALISCRPSGTVETWNPGAEQLFGYRTEEIVGKSLSLIVPADRMMELDAQLAAVMRGETVSLDTVRQHKDETLIDVALTAVPIMTAGWITSVSFTIQDIRERKRRDTHISLLNRELAHRVKNTLAVIQSIANQTMRSSPQPEAFRVAFQGRLQALAAANDLLMETSWDGAELDSFIDKQLAPLMPRSSRQLTKSGPVVIIPAELSIPLGLALHELGTNAIKYGAWSIAGGVVELTWELKASAEDDDEPNLVVVWRERFGPPPIPSNRRGFGTTLIERGIPGAIVERTLGPSGLVCSMTLPLPGRTGLGAV